MAIIDMAIFAIIDFITLIHIIARHYWPTFSRISWLIRHYARPFSATAGDIYAIISLRRALRFRH